MLTRNCTTDLFGHGDRNVRVTLFDKNPKHYVSESYKIAWIDTIRDSLGNGIIHSPKHEAFSIRQTGNEKPYLFKGTGAEFIQNLYSYFQKPKSIRIDLLGDPVRSWIILIPNDNTVTPNTNKIVGVHEKETLSGTAKRFLIRFDVDASQANVFILYEDPSTMSEESYKKLWLEMIEDGIKKFSDSLTFEQRNVEFFYYIPGDRMPTSYSSLLYKHNIVDHLNRHFDGPVPLRLKIRDAYSYDNDHFLYFICQY